MKILHVSNFTHRKKGQFIFGVPYKLSQGFTRLNHFVANFSDRDVAASSFPGIREWARPHVNRELIRVCMELRPDLLLLGHCHLVSPETVCAIRAKLKGIRIAHWNVDALFTSSNFDHLARFAPFVDMTFVTTAGDYQRRLAEAGGPVAYMPNPVDASVEILRVFEKNDLPHDLIFMAGRHGYNEERARICEQIRKAVPELKFHVGGLWENPRVYGADYFDALGNAHMGLSLSARNDVHLYASDRMAQLMGCGLLTFVDRASGFGELFADDELITYRDLNDLAGKLVYFRDNDAARRDCARRGWEHVHREFNSTLVAQWIVDGAFGSAPSRNYAWPTDIFCGPAPLTAKHRLAPASTVAQPEGIPLAS